MLACSLLRGPPDNPKLGAAPAFNPGITASIMSSADGSSMDTGPGNDTPPSFATDHGRVLPMSSAATSMPGGGAGGNASAENASDAGHDVNFRSTLKEARVGGTVHEHACVCLLW